MRITFDMRVTFSRQEQDGVTGPPDIFFVIKNATVTIESNLDTINRIVEGLKDVRELEVVDA